MPKLTLSILLFLMNYSSIAWSAEVKCSPYDGTSENTLENMAVFFDAKYLGDKEAVEIITNSEKTRDDMLIQRWDLTGMRNPKIFIRCYYKNKSEITFNVDNSVDICQLIKKNDKKNLNSINHTITISNAGCYKKDTLSTFIGKTCGVIGH
jgi:hypothetical protein